MQWLTNFTYLYVIRLKDPPGYASNSLENIIIIDVYQLNIDYMFPIFKNTWFFPGNFLEIIKVQTHKIKGYQTYQTIYFYGMAL